MRSAFDVPTLLADPPEVSVADPDPDPDPDPVLELAWTVNGFTPSDPPVALETSRLNKPVLECCEMLWLRLLELMAPPGPVAQMKLCELDEVSRLPPLHERQFEPKPCQYAPTQAGRG